MIPRAKKGGRKRTIDVRQIINAIFYATDNGVKWRSLPKEYPHWETVYGYFKRWTDDQTIEKIHRKLRKINRVIAGKKPDETVSIIDSQTVRGTEEGYRRGFDAGKKTKGRKRHLVVDTMGLVIEALVHSAGIQDRDGARYTMSKAKTNGASFAKCYVDGGYRGKFVDWAKTVHDVIVEVVKRSDIKGFVVLPKRWIVERTLAWLSRCRRLARDYERLEQTVRSFIFPGDDQTDAQTHCERICLNF